MEGLQINGRIKHSHHPRRLRKDEHDRQFLDALGVVFYCAALGGQAAVEKESFVLSAQQCTDTDAACVVDHGVAPYVALDDSSYMGGWCLGGVTLTRDASSGTMEFATPLLTMTVSAKHARQRFDGDRTLHLDLEITPKAPLSQREGSGVLGITLDQPCYGTRVVGGAAWPEYLSGGWRAYRVSGDSLTAHTFLLGTDM